MKGSEIGSAAFRGPPEGGPRKAQPEVCLESRSPQQSVGLRGKSLIFRLKVTRVRQARNGHFPFRSRRSLEEPADRVKLRERDPPRSAKRLCRLRDLPEPC